MNKLFVATYVTLSFALGFLAFGCAPVDCELNPNQPECRGEEFEPEDDTQAVPVQIARSKVRGDSNIALIEHELAPAMPQGVLLFVPPLKVEHPDWRIQTASASWRWNGSTPNGGKYLFSDPAGYVRVGRFVPTGTYCYATKVEGDRMQCRDERGGPAVFLCPVANIVQPMAYSEKPGGAFSYDFATRFRMTDLPLPKANRVTLGTGIKANGTQAAVIYCQYPLANRTITVVRR